MDIPVFKIRCSAAGKIMTNPKGKSKMDLYLEAKASLESLNKRYDDLKDKKCKTALDITDNKIPGVKKLITELENVKDEILFSDTCMSYMIEWILEKKYNRRKDFTSKYTEKGKITEQDGFQLIQEVLFNGSFLSKNDEQFEDEYKTGVPDVVRKSEDFLLDNKSSYTLFTFPVGETEIKNKDYDYQLDGYMDLAKVNNAILCYTLNNTPYSIIEDEIKRLAYTKYRDTLEVPDDECYEIVKNHVFTLDGLKECRSLYGMADTSDFVEIPKEKRLIHFKKQKNRESIDNLHKRVLECRDWINKNWNNF